MTDHSKAMLTEFLIQTAMRMAPRTHQKAYGKVHEKARLMALWIQESSVQDTTHLDAD